MRRTPTTWVIAVGIASLESAAAFAENAPVPKKFGLKDDFDRGKRVGAANNEWCRSDRVSTRDRDLNALSSVVCHK